MKTQLSETSPLIAEEVLENSMGGPTLEDDRLESVAVEFYETTDLQQWHQRPRIWMIAVSVFLFALSVGVSISPKVQLTMDLISNQLCRTDPAGCAPADVQKRLSSLTAEWTAGGAIVSTLCSGKLGSFSDQFGRKPLLSFSATVNLIGRVFVFYLVYPGRDFHPNLLILATCFEQLGGGIFFIIALANSYVTDLVEAHMRVSFMGIVVAAMYCGMSLGPVLGSLLTKATGTPVAAMYVDLIVLSSLCVFLVFILPESRSLKSRRDSIESAASVKKGVFIEAVNLLSPLQAFWLPVKRENGQFSYRPRINVLILLFIDIGITAVTVCLGAIVVLYGIYAYKWTSVDMGYFISISMGLKTFSLLLLAPWVLHYLKSRFKPSSAYVDMVDLVVIQGSIVCEILNMLILIGATSSLTFMSSTIPASMGSLATPTIHSAIVKYADPSKVGEVFGALALVRNLVMFVLPAMFLMIYSKTVETHPMTIFVICVVILVVSGMSSLGLYYKKDLRWLSDDDSTEEEVQ